MTSNRDIPIRYAEERIADVAAILARGLLRLYSRAALAGAPNPLPVAEELPKSSQDCLE